MELDRKIFVLVYQAINDEMGDFNASDCTKAILALPEIRDALAFVKGLPGFSPDSPQARQAIPAPSREA
jgi:hypothetical protein